MTGETKISAQALLEYFKPLQEYLKELNNQSNDEIMENILYNYNDAAGRMTKKVVQAEWDVATDTNNKEKAETLNRVLVENSEFVNKWYEQYKHYEPSNFTDKSIQRQVRLLRTRGINTLEVSDLEKVSFPQKLIK